MITRKTVWGPGTDVFIVKVSAIRDIIKNYPIIEALPVDDFAKENGVWNAETYFGAYIVNRVEKVYTLHLNHSHWKFTELGFFHIYPNADPNGPTDAWGMPWWNKENYEELYE